MTGAWNPSIRPTAELDGARVTIALWTTTTGPTELAVDMWTARKLRDALTAALEG